MNLFSGLEEVLVTGAQQNVPFPMLVMYPTDVPSNPTPLGPYIFDVALKAPIKQGHFPLVIISHGSGSSKQVFRTLAEYLAQNGFIVCMPEHPFNNRNDNTHADTIENLNDRPRHISESIHWILSNSKWKHSIQKNHVAIIGHSIGGYTALALAGGIPHTKHQIQHDPHTKITHAQQIDVKPDQRIKAVVLLAPATGWFKSPGALRQVKVPILMLSGEKDTITPLFHAEIVKGGITNHAQVTHRVVENAGHFSFLSPFPDSMKTPNFPPAYDPDGFDREKFHAEMNAEIVRFLKKCFQD